jgi:sensor histidine kinase YesM
MRGHTLKHPVKSSIRKKIVIGFIVFFCIPFLFFEIILFQSWLGTTRSIVIHQYETILNDEIGSLRQSIESVEKMNDYIYRDHLTDSVLFNKLTATSDGLVLRNDPYLNAVYTQLSNQFFSQFNDELEFSFLSMNGELIYRRSNRPGQVQFLNFMENYSQQPWFQHIVQNGPVKSVLSAHRSFFQPENPASYFSFARVIRSPFDLTPTGVSLLTVNASVFQKLLKTKSDNELIKTIVTDGQQNVMFTNDAANRFPVHSSHILKQTLEPYDWEINAYLSSERLSQSYLVSLIQNNALFVIASILLLAVIIWFFSRQLKPLYLLAEKMKKARDGEFHVKIGKYSTDELGMLGDIFNEMTTEIQRLFENQKREYQEKLYFQMKSLETQINPHFIYNMLDMIQCRVYEENPDKASDLIVSLSVIMRYTTTRPGEKVTCAEELKWMNDYIFLQQQLIGQRVDVRIEFEERVMSCKVHKLILQPIIENAFIHGFEHRRNQSELLIKGYEDDGMLVFEVRDNGQGFPEPVDLLLTRRNVDELKDWGIGLYVTAQRFLLQSDHAVIRLHSAPGTGTHIIMKQNCTTKMQIS